MRSVPSTLYRTSSPVLGYMDELVILPLGIMLAVRLVPTALMAEFRAEAMRATSRPAAPA